MADIRKVTVRQDNGHQVVVLPEEFHVNATEVYITRDDATGNLILINHPERSSPRSYLEFRDSLGISGEDLDNYMADRPMNRVSNPRNVFEDEA